MRLADFVMLLIRKKHELYNNSVKYRKNLPELLCFSCFTIPAIYLPIIAVLLVTYNEHLRLILPALFSFAKVLRRGNAKYRYAGRSANGLVDLTTTFRNFHQVLIGYFINSSAIYLSYPSVSTVSWLHVKFRSRQESR